MNRRIATIGTRFAKPIRDEVRPPIYTRRFRTMKRFITTFLTTAMLAVTIPAMATTSIAQTRNCDSNNQRYQNESREYSQYANEADQYDRVQYRNDGRPNVYQRHRKSMNIAIATGAGAIIGGLIGGKKGALIGAAAGVAGGVVVTKKQAPNNYYRRY